MFLNNMSIYVNKQCLQIQRVNYVNWILKIILLLTEWAQALEFKPDWILSLDSFSITLSSSPFSLPILPSATFFAYKLQAQCLQVAILGWVRLDINGVSEILYCVFSLEFVHSSSSCSADGKQHKPMTNNPAKTPGWFQEWIPIMQSHVGRRNDSQW